jgi:hypothetical protein
MCYLGIEDKEVNGILLMKSKNDILSYVVQKYKIAFPIFITGKNE